MTPRKAPRPGGPTPPLAGPAGQAPPPPAAILAQATRPDGVRVFILITGQKIILPPQAKEMS